MINLIKLFGEIVYNNIPFTILGHSGGSYAWPPNDYIPDSIINLHKIIYN